MTGLSAVGRGRLEATILLALVPLAVGCAAIRRLGGPPPDARVHVVSMQDLVAGDVLELIADELEDEEGFHKAQYNLVRAELEVWTRPELGPEAVVRALAQRGLQGVPAPGQGSYRPPRGYPVGSDARILTLRGHDIPDLARHAVPGKVTVFDFYADWCGPCRALDGHFIRILTARPDVAVRKLNIVDFQSPLAARWIRGGIPFVVVYNRAGTKVVELSGSDPARIAIALGRATISKE